MKWIEISEALPAPEVRVLVLWNRYSKAVMMLKHDFQEFYNSWMVLPVHVVTHWCLILDDGKE